MGKLFKTICELHPLVLGAIISSPLLPIIFFANKAVVLIAIDVYFGIGGLVLFIAIVYYLVKTYINTSLDMRKALKLFVVLIVSLSALALLICIYFEDGKGNMLGILLILLGLCWSTIAAIRISEIISE